MRLSGKYVPILITAMLLVGCASNGDPRDPLEPTNRVIHSFNEKLDRVALKPLAKGYQAVTPTPVQNSIRNFYANLDDVSVFANDVLQFKLERAASDFLRVSFNSTFGLLGLIDISTPMGLKKHNEDFGQTLGYWGLASGPYLVLPFFGPSSIRDGVGLVVDGLGSDLVNKHEDIANRNQALALRAIGRRADLLEAKEALDEAALDPYEFSRDFYLDRREALVTDGRSRPDE